MGLGCSANFRPAQAKHVAVQRLSLKMFLALTCLTDWRPEGWCRHAKARILTAITSRQLSLPLPRGTAPNGCPQMRGIEFLRKSPAYGSASSGVWGHASPVNMHLGEMIPARKSKLPPQGRRASAALPGWAGTQLMAADLHHPTPPSRASSVG